MGQSSVKAFWSEESHCDAHGVHVPARGNAAVDVPASAVTGSPRTSAALGIKRDDTLAAGEPDLRPALGGTELALIEH